MKTKLETPELPFRSWGGKRKGAGRKPNSSETVPHSKRPPLSRHYPAHILRSRLPSLRNRRVFAVVLSVLRAAKERTGFRLNHFSVQSNHGPSGIRVG